MSQRWLNECKGGARDRGGGIGEDLPLDVEYVARGVGHESEDEESLVLAEEVEEVIYLLMTIARWL